MIAPSLGLDAQMGLFDDTHQPVKVDVDVGHNVSNGGELPFTGLRLNITWHEKIAGPVTEHYVLTEDAAIIIIAALSNGLIQLQHLRKR